MRVPSFDCADSTHELETPSMFSTAMDATKEMWQELRGQGCPEIGEGSPEQGTEGREREREGSKLDMWITLSFLFHLHRLGYAWSSNSLRWRMLCCRSGLVDASLPSSQWFKFASGGCFAKMVG